MDKKIIDGNLALIEERKDFIVCNKKEKGKKIKCDSQSVAGAVSQRACVYCGARVVLNPITDAVHLVHGPIGCAAYTFDIRGSLSSGSEEYRNSYSTDLRERDIIFGGEQKLTAAIDEIMEFKNPKLIFVYSTCVVGVIGDDLQAICKAAEKKYGIRVIPVESSGFVGSKSAGYKAAGDAILKILDLDGNSEGEKKGINFLGDFNLAGELWIIKGYLKEIGIDVVAHFSGDSNYEQIKEAPTALFNVVQCAGSMTSLAKKFEEKYGTPYTKVSFFGLEDIRISLRSLAYTLGDFNVIKKTEEFVKKMEKETTERLEPYRKKLAGKKVAIYVGGGFKAISLIKQFRDLGITPVMVGSQTGRPEEYEIIRKLSDENTVILDDANPSELERFMREKGADMLVGGVKERPLAYKLGIGFIDHNHARKHPLAGYEGAINFAKEIDLTVNSPVWDIIKKNGMGIE
ncbi:nitrogenase iron-molybdenum cofactor biosynthesis protein NifE [uncultured Ilyobacter sp.]|uniref:nitrogenase iron-molybdenum cofactor biosynthesis protein NifE n=1 Tax=uncultured Ilyobacter sp. TaxID=544433 RepID=UPI0029C8335B|nr:nitrogenase iron-molybdenum cofactor biosynthesis protein NifE [uncultured Ilyobacter sp.]